MKYLYFFLHLTVVCFLLSCSTTPKFSSQFSNKGDIPSGTADLDPYMRQAGIERHTVEGIAFFVTNDTENMYLMVDFVSARIFELAKEFGFTLYIDSPGKVNRSFGITFPTGLFYELSNYPGMQTAYLEEPNWSNFPENKAIIESVDRNMSRQALISQRQSRRDNIQPVLIRFSQLNAQNLLLHSTDDGRSGRLSFTIPLQIRSTSQFSPDIQPGDEVGIGFEINPIRLFNLESNRAAPLIANDPSGGRTHSQTEEQQQQQERLMRILRRLGGDPYEQWFKVRLAKPE